MQVVANGFDMNPLRFENEILINLKHNIMLQKISKYLITKQWFISFVRLSLPDEKELNALRSQYRASGGDAGWIQDAYKKGYIDGWNKKRKTANGH